MSSTRRPYSTIGTGVLIGWERPWAEFGSLSGALEHFFDTVYYPRFDATVGLPYGSYVHGGDDTAGALTAIARITGALRWRQVAAALSLTGPPSPAYLEACRELAATVAVALEAYRPAARVGTAASKGVLTQVGEMWRTASQDGSGTASGAWSGHRS